MCNVFGLNDRENWCLRDRGTAVVKASAGVLAAVVKGELEEHGVLAHAALRLLSAFADDPLCNRAFCHSGIHSACSANVLTAKAPWQRPAALPCEQLES